MWKLAFAPLVLALQAPLLAQPLELILLRHGDKLVQRGDYNLSPNGLLRAINLARLLPACFGAIDGIGVYGFNLKTQKNARSYQSAVPLAVATGLNIKSFPEADRHGDAVAAELLHAPWSQGKRLVLFWEHRRLPALAAALGWPLMEPIAAKDFGGLYQLRYSAGTFVPQVSHARHSELFQRPCFRQARSPLPVVPLPDSSLP